MTPIFRDDQLRLRQLPDLMSQHFGVVSAQLLGATATLFRFERHNLVKLLESNQSQLVLRIFSSRRHGYEIPTANSEMSSEPTATQSRAASTRPLQPTTRLSAEPSPRQSTTPTPEPHPTHPAASATPIAVVEIGNMQHMSPISTAARKPISTNTTRQGVKISN